MRHRQRRALIWCFPGILTADRLVRKQLDIITSAIPGGIKISNDDESYSFKYVSEQYAAMLGYTVEEFMEASNGSVVGIAHPDDLESGLPRLWNSTKKQIIMRSRIE